VSFAKPLPDYRGELMQRVRSRLGPGVYHANVCILHHVFAELDGHNLGEFEGTMVFGEIAYILHNQTVVFSTV